MSFRKISFFLFPSIQLQQMPGERRKPRSDSGRVGGGKCQGIAPRPKNRNKHSKLGTLRSPPEPSAVRVWVTHAGYDVLKPSPTIVEGCAVVLYHSALATADGSASNALANIATVAQTAFMGDPAASSSAAAGWPHMLAVDVTQLEPRAEPFATLLRRECGKKGALTKGLGRAVHRTMDRLLLRGATLVAVGELAQLAMKLVLGTSDRSIAEDGEIERVILIHPELPPATVNAYMRGAAVNPGLRVDVVYRSESALARRDAIVRAVFPRGASRVGATAPRGAESVATHAELARALLLVDVLPNTLGGDGAADADEGGVAAPAVLGAEYDAAFEDARGRTLFFSELIFDADSVVNKQDAVDRTAQTAAYLENLRVAFGIGGGGDAAGSDADEAEDYADDVSLDEVGACVVRGSRCLVVRDAAGRALRLPSVVPRAGESAAEAALRAVVSLAAFDAAELEPIDAVPPVALYRGGAGPGEGRRVLLHAFRAVGAAAAAGEVEDMEESASEETDIRRRGWISLPRAYACLDKRSIAALRTMARALDAAVVARRIRWADGGTFGGEMERVLQ
jgi:hypothetical protein